MNWDKLLCSTRLCKSETETPDGRTPFQKDIDRIVYSSAFRRLANKTQVQPLSEDDHTHSRLTHSIETASVGRSIGTIVGTKLGQDFTKYGFTPDDLGYVVQAACLAHDIGNPPFGHAGENAIGSWFSEKFKSDPTFRTLKLQEKSDFEHFEGNAQGFRILTQLENHKMDGGLQLTHAVLGTFIKYPISSLRFSKDKSNYIGSKKPGFFKSEEKYFTEIGNSLELPKINKRHNERRRHPLTFIVEAADDTCYNIVDIEDAYSLGDLTFKTAEALLSPLVQNYKKQSGIEKHEEIAYLRALAIGETVQILSDVFTDNITSILSGDFETDLIDASNIKDEFADLRATSKEHIFTTRRKTMLEIAGHKIIHELLNVFFEALVDLMEKDWDTNKTSENTKRIIRFMQSDFKRVDNLYDGLLTMTDFISGMTDRFALKTYRQLSGISV